MPSTNSTAHTAGPWFFSQESVDPEWYIVTIKGGLIVANVNAHFRQEANARLIAAAPELLEAVQELLATHPAAYRDAGPIDNRTDNAVKIARAAIAAAKGGAA